jgi:hypothetical protein
MRDALAGAHVGAGDMKTRWLVIAAALVLVIAIAVGVFVLRSGSAAARQTLWPTAAELSQPDGAARLLGGWVYRGTVLMDDGGFIPSPSRQMRTFSADGTERDTSFPKGVHLRWATASHGQLHEWATNDVYDAYPHFFFRNNRLYIEGDSSWEVYQRR